MKRSIYFDDFVEAFEEMGRMGHFSEEGLKALFDYLEEYEEDTGIEIELDVIAYVLSSQSIAILKNLKKITALM